MAAAFCQSQYVTALGLLHNPRFAAPTSFSRFRSTVSRRAYCRDHHASPARKISWLRFRLSDDAQAVRKLLSDLGVLAIPFEATAAIGETH